ncbi:MAG TPA: APC family permease [Candidatus Binatia bacterium]|nr:APC family permease [Candidatus Binatia bacterium]
MLQHGPASGQAPEPAVFGPGEGPAAEPHPSALERLRRRFIGRARDPLDPHVFHQISLVAFLAWVGLGADGLSSSCYGPEAAYLALGDHHFLALVLAGLMAITVFVISASYSQIIELFPTGGGGYLVATSLLGSGAGLVSGCALVIDYILTISVSIASGADAVFSLFPPGAHRWELTAAAGVIVLLIVMNLRGVRESVTLLVPIFLLFVLTHAITIAAAILTNAGDAPRIVADAYAESRQASATLGFGALAIMLMRAYSLGGGTYTGIEAVSNGLQILREPRVATARRTMMYMAISLAVVASGILVSYLLIGVKAHPDKTLNAVLIEQVAASWPGGRAFLFVTLLSEGALLFVAAQAGFLDGPRVLANMAIDSWVPRRFYELSERLVTENGIVLMGGSALAILLYTHGDVGMLVVMYSINVFLTFSLSQLGMCVHWWQVRATEPRWRRKLAVNGLGLVLTSSILCATVTLKFAAGGWLTVAMTTGFVAVCLWIRRHYDSARRAVGRLDEILTAIPMDPNGMPRPARDPGAPTAVFLVNGYNGLGLHAVLSVPRLFGGHFKNFVFVSVGVIDSSRFKGASEVENLRKSTEEGLERYVKFTRGLGGVHAEYAYALGTDTIEEIQKLCRSVAQRFPRAVFFAGKLVFAQENLMHRLLHNQAAVTIQRRLQFDGLPMVVLPVRAL